MFSPSDRLYGTDIIPIVGEQWSATSIPAAIKLVPGFDERFKTICQLMMLPPPSPVTATQVLTSARSHQSNASAFRLGKTIALPSSSHNLPKVEGVIKERQRTRMLAQKADTSIAVIVSLWKVEGSLKAKPVCLV